MNSTHEIHISSRKIKIVLSIQMNEVNKMREKVFERIIDLCGNKIVDSIFITESNPMVETSIFNKLHKNKKDGIPVHLNTHTVGVAREWVEQYFKQYIAETGDDIGKITDPMVMHSAAGYYIGNASYDLEMMAWVPHSRMSYGYWATDEEARRFLPSYME